MLLEIWGKEGCKPCRPLCAKEIAEAKSATAAGRGSTRRTQTKRNVLEMDFAAGQP